MWRKLINEGEHTWMKFRNEGELRWIKVDDVKWMKM